MAGVSTALKAHNADIKIGVVDPMGSALYGYYKNGELKTEGRSIAEGIGISIITDNIREAIIDMAYQISDEEALPYIYHLLKREGLCLGGSSAINIAGAVHLAKEMGPGHTIVTILCDYGHRYQSKLFNPAFSKTDEATCSRLDQLGLIAISLIKQQTNQNIPDITFNKVASLNQRHIGFKRSCQFNSIALNTHNRSLQQPLLKRR